MSSDPVSHLRWLRLPRVAECALAAAPAWLWSGDGDLLWTNAAGALAFGHANLSAAVQQKLSPGDPHRRRVVQLMRRERPLDSVRLERLPGFGGRFGSLTTCICRLVALPDQPTGLLIVSSESSALSATQRLAGLIDGFTLPVFAMTTDGGRTCQNASADAWAAQNDLLADPALQFIIGQAADEGYASGDLPGARVEIFRAGGAGERVLLKAVVPSPACTAAQKSATHETIVPSLEPDAPAATSTDQPAPPAMDPIAPPPLRTLPLRFMWSSDADGRFMLQSDEFARLLGPNTAAAFDRPWREIATALGLDRDGTISQAFASSRTFNGLTVDWPTDDPATTLHSELSGVPIHDGARSFAGFRGFGLVRDLDALSMRERALSQYPQDNSRTDDSLRPSALSAAVTPAAHVVASPAQPSVEPPANVVPFRNPTVEVRPTLTPVEDNAFNELARQLSARLDDPRKVAAAAPEIDETATAEAGPNEPFNNPPAWLAPRAQTPTGESNRDVALIDRIPTGVLIYRLDRLLYANAAFLARVGYSSLTALADAGGLDALYVEPGVSDASSTSDTGTPMQVSSGQSDNPPTEAALHTITWDGEQAMALIFAPPARAAVAAPVVEPAPVPIVPPAPQDRTVEREAREQRMAERTADAKADVLARVSHEVRTPLNAIIGFAEVMIAERFGALGNERYAEYLKDIRASGERVIAIIDDMLNLSHIETGKLDLTFANQNLNDLVESCVGVMQPQANRERIIIRTALTRSLPWISADARALRQITMNLIGNSIHLANAGGQVIVSTAVSDIGDVLLRVRDTGHGLNDNEIASALAPFRAPTSSADVTNPNSAISLSLTKALVEANRAQFQIKSSPQSGTLIEVRFSSTAVRAG